MRNKTFFLNNGFFNFFFIAVLGLLALMLIGSGVAIYYALSDGLPWAIAIVERITGVPKP